MRIRTLIRRGWHLLSEDQRGPSELCMATIPPVWKAGTMTDSPELRLERVKLLGKDRRESPPPRKSSEGPLHKFIPIGKGASVERMMGSPAFWLTQNR